MEINDQYKALCAGPPKGQNIRQWLNKWEKIYVEAKEIKHNDAESGYIVDYFIRSLKGLDSSWASASQYDLDMKRSNGKEVPSFMDILNNFRRKYTTDQHTTNISSSFAATLQGRPSEPASPDSRSASPRPTPRCICGKTHWFQDCFYLMETKRPKNWKPNAEIMKKVDEALQDPVFKGKVDKSKQRLQKFQTSATPTTPIPTTPASENPSEPQQHPRTFGVIWHSPGDAKPTPSSHSVLKPSNYDIVNSWILDSGPNIHVCNDSHRFTPTHTTTSEDYLVCGTTTYPIEAYGTVDIAITTPTGSKKIITLQQYACIT